MEEEGEEVVQIILDQQENTWPSQQQKSSKRTDNEYQRNYQNSQSERDLQPLKLLANFENVASNNQQQIHSASCSVNAYQNQNYFNNNTTEEQTLRPTNENSHLFYSEQQNRKTFISNNVENNEGEKYTNQTKIEDQKSGKGSKQEPKIETAQYQQQTLSEESIKFQAQIKQKQAEIIEFKESINAKYQDLVKKERSFIQNEEELDRRKKEISELQKQLVQQQQAHACERGEIMALYEQNKEENSRKIMQYEQQIKIQEERISTDRAQISNLQDKYSQQEFEITQLRKTNFDLDRHIQKQCTMLQSSLMSSGRKFDDGLANHNSLSQQVDLLKYQLQETQEQLQKSQKQYDSMQKELKEAWEKSDHFKRENLQLMIENSSVKNENESLKAQLQVDPKFMTEYQKNQNTILQKINEYESTMKRYINQVTENKKMSQEKTQQIDVLILDNKRLIEEKEEFYKQLDEKSQEIESFKRKIEMYEKSQLEEQVKEQKDVYTEKMNELTGQFQHILNQISNQDQQMQKLDDEKLEAMKQKDYWFNKYQQEEEKVQDLEQKIEQQQQTIDDLQVEIDNFNSGKPLTRGTKAAGKKQNGTTNNRKKVSEKYNTDDEMGGDTTNLIQPKQSDQMTNFITQPIATTINNNSNGTMNSNNTPSAINSSLPPPPAITNTITNSIKENILKKQNKQGIFAKAIMCPNCKILIRTNVKKQNNVPCDSCGDLVHKTCIDKDEKNIQKQQQVCSICYAEQEGKMQIENQ